VDGNTILEIQALNGGHHEDLGGCRGGNKNPCEAPLRDQARGWEILGWRESASTSKGTHGWDIAQWDRPGLKGRLLEKRASRETSHQEARQGTRGAGDRNTAVLRRAGHKYLRRGKPTGAGGSPGRPTDHFFPPAGGAIKTRKEKDWTEGRILGSVMVAGPDRDVWERVPLSSDLRSIKG